MQVAYFTLAERSLFWLNTLVTGHGPEAVAARVEKYRSAHHCDIVVEAEEGILLEWVKEDYEIGRVECFNRDQEGPSKLHFSYSCKPSNFGGLLEGVVCLQLLVHHSKTCGPPPHSMSISASSEEVGSTVPTAQAGLPPAQPSLLDSAAISASGTVGMQASESLPPEFQKPTIQVVVCADMEGPVVETSAMQYQSWIRRPSAPAIATHEGPTKAFPSHSCSPSPLPQPCPASPAPPEPPFLRAASAAELWAAVRRWCPIRRPRAPRSTKLPTASSLPLPISTATLPAVTAPKIVTASTTNLAVEKVPGQLGRPPLEASGPSCSSAAHANAPAHSLLQVSHSASSATSSSNALGSAGPGEEASARSADNEQGVHTACSSTAPVAALNVVSEASSSQGLSVEEKSPAKEGTCAIYFCVDPYSGGNRFGVSCTDDAQNLVRQRSAAEGDAIWWNVCSRRNSKAERNPSKVACWHAAAGNSDPELNKSCQIFGAHERMPLRKEDCVGIGVSAEMTSCLDATLKLKFKLADAPLCCQVTACPSVTAETPAAGSELVPCLSDSTVCPPTPLPEALTHGPVERAGGIAGDQPPATLAGLASTLPTLAPPEPLWAQLVNPSPVLPAPGVEADEVVLDVKPISNVVAEAEEVQPMQEEMQQSLLEPIAATELSDGYATSARSISHEATIDAESKGFLSVPADKIPQWSLANPWEALRLPPQQPSFMVWHASPAARPALADISKMASDVATKTQSLGATLLAVASAAPSMGPSANDVQVIAEINEVQESTRIRSVEPVLILEKVVTAPT